MNINAGDSDLWLKNPVNDSCQGVSYTWVSEKDKGQYDAIRQGFEKASGSVFAYINSDDMYVPNAFSLVMDVFHHNLTVHWLKGLNKLLRMLIRILSRFVNLHYGVSGIVGKSSN